MSINLRYIKNVLLLLFLVGLTFFFIGRMVMCANMVDGGRLGYYSSDKDFNFSRLFNPDCLNKKCWEPDLNFVKYGVIQCDLE